MKFHGRMAPGRILDPAQPVQVVIHAPARCASVTLKIWELDAFVDASGKRRREGSPDDLLATFTGAIEPARGSRGARPPDWRAFRVDSARIEAAPPGAVWFRLQLPGADTIHDIPIRSEADEVEGTDLELGFSIEVGGAEKFRTRAPCLFAPARRPLRVVARYITCFDESAKPVPEAVYQEPLAHRHVAIGRRDGNGDDATLEVLARGYIDCDGYLIEPPRPGHETAAGRPLIVSAGRDLFLFDDAMPIAATGKTRIPIAACDPIAGAGPELTVLRAAVPHPMTLQGADDE